MTGAVPIYVALIAAGAAVFTSFITARKDRRDQRARILQDLEILEKLRLPTEQQVALPLRYRILERLMVVAAEDDLAELNRDWFFLATSIILMAVPITWVVMNDGRDWTLILIMFIVLCWVFILLQVYRRRRDKLIVKQKNRVPPVKDDQQSSSEEKAERHEPPEG